MGTPNADQIALMNRRRAQQERNRQVAAYETMQKDRESQPIQYRNRINAIQGEKTQTPPPFYNHYSQSFRPRQPFSTSRMTRTVSKTKRNETTSNTTSSSITASPTVIPSVENPLAGQIVYDLGEYGTITQGTIKNRYNIDISAPKGYTAKVSNTTAEEVNKIIAELNKSLQGNISYIMDYSDLAASGEEVVKAKNSLFTIGREAADTYQGGYEKTYTQKDFEQMVQPYQNMLNITGSLRLPIPSSSPISSPLQYTPQTGSSTNFNSFIVSSSTPADRIPSPPSSRYVTHVQNLSGIELYQYLTPGEAEVLQTYITQHGVPPEGKYWTVVTTCIDGKFQPVVVARTFGNLFEVAAAQQSTLSSVEGFQQRLIFNPKSLKLQAVTVVDKDYWDKIGTVNISDLTPAQRELITITPMPYMTPKTITYQNGAFTINYEMDLSQIPTDTDIPYSDLPKYNLSGIMNQIPSDASIRISKSGEVSYTIPSKTSSTDIDFAKLPDTIPASDLAKYGLADLNVPSGATVYVDKEHQTFYYMPKESATPIEGFALVPKFTETGAEFSWVPDQSYWSSPKSYSSISKDTLSLLGITDPEYLNPELVTYDPKKGQFSVSYTPDWDKLPETIPSSELEKYGLSFPDVPAGSIIKVDKATQQFTVSQLLKEGGNVDFGVPVTANAIFGSSFINVEGVGSIGTDPVILPDPTTIVHPFTEYIFNLTKDIKYPGFAAAVGAGGIEPTVAKTPSEAQLFYPGQALAGAIGSVEGIINPNIPTLWSSLSPSSEQAEFMRTHPSYLTGSALGEIAQLAIPVPYIGTLGKWASESSTVSKVITSVAHSKPMQLLQKMSSVYDESMVAALKKMGYSPSSLPEDFLFIGTRDELSSRVASTAYSGYIENISDIQQLMKSRNIPSIIIKTSDIAPVADPMKFDPLRGWVRPTLSKESKLFLEDIKTIDVTTTIRQPSQFSSFMKLMPESPLEQYSKLLSKAESYDEMFKISTSKLGKPATIKKAKPSLGGVVSIEEKATLGDIENILDTSANWFTKPSKEDIIRQSIKTQPPLYDSILGDVPRFKIESMTDEKFAEVFERAVSDIPDFMSKSIIDLKGEKEISRLIGKGSQYQLAKKASSKGTKRVESIFHPRDASDYLGTDLWMPSERITVMPSDVPKVKETILPLSTKKKPTRPQYLIQETRQATDYDYLFTYREKESGIITPLLDVPQVTEKSLALLPLSTPNIILKTASKSGLAQTHLVKPIYTTETSFIPTSMLKTKLRMGISPLPISDVAMKTGKISETSQESLLKLIPDTVSLSLIKSASMLELKQSQKITTKATIPIKPIYDISARTPKTPFNLDSSEKTTDIPSKRKDYGWGYFELTHYVSNLLGISKVKKGKPVKGNMKVHQ